MHRINIRANWHQICMKTCHTHDITVSFTFEKVLSVVCFSQGRSEYHLPLAELFKWGTNHTPTLYDTVSSNPDISKIASDDAVVHYNGLRARHIINLRFSE